MQKQIRIESNLITNDSLPKSEVSDKEKTQSEQLEQTTHKLISNNTGPLITSLVPTQLIQLIKHPAGIRWLQMFSIIWVGGSAIPENLAYTS